MLSKSSNSSGRQMEPNDNPDDQTILKEDRREAKSDWIAMAGLVAALCIGFAVLVAAGYGVRALLRTLN